jgi:hypothetical protein
MIPIIFPDLHASLGLCWLPASDTLTLNLKAEKHMK